MERKHPYCGIGNDPKEGVLEEALYKKKDWLRKPEKTVAEPSRDMNLLESSGCGNPYSVLSLEADKIEAEAVKSISKNEFYARLRNIVLQYLPRSSKKLPSQFARFIETAWNSDVPARNLFASKVMIFDLGEIEPLGNRESGSDVLEGLEKLLNDVRKDADHSES